MRSSDRRRRPRRQLHPKTRSAAAFQKHDRAGGVGDDDGVGEFADERGEEPGRRAPVSVSICASRPRRPPSAGGERFARNDTPAGCRGMVDGQESQSAGPVQTWPRQRPLMSQRRQGRWLTDWRIPISGGGPLVPSVDHPLGMLDQSGGRRESRPVHRGTRSGCVPVGWPCGFSLQLLPGTLLLLRPGRRPAKSACTRRRRAAAAT